MAAGGKESCGKWLKENCCVNVRNEWLEACIEFLNQEHGATLTSQSQINDLVYEQLIMADFEEMSLGSLPNLAGDLVVIQGKHTLQINSMLDVGHSAYSQIQKMKGKDDPETLKESSTANDNWEKKIKPSRMLFLEMTDGSQSIQAMEYQKVPCLNQNIVPGTKVQIQGPITCRLGVLLLNAKNIHILGGSVEDLVEKNSLWNMLHKAIGKEPPPQPANVKVEEPDTKQETPVVSTGNNSGSSHGSANVQTITSHGSSSYVQTAGRQQSAQQSNTKNQKKPTSKGKDGTWLKTNHKRPQPSTSMNFLGKSFEQFDENFKQFDENFKHFEDNSRNNFEDNFEVDFFDEAGDENFDFDQLDQMEQEVTESGKPCCTITKSDQSGNSHNVGQGFDNQFDDYDDDQFANELMNDDFDLDDFDLDTSKQSKATSSFLSEATSSKTPVTRDLKSKAINTLESQVKSKTRQCRLSLNITVNGPPKKKQTSTTTASNIIKIEIDSDQSTTSACSNSIMWKNNSDLKLKTSERANIQSSSNIVGKNSSVLKPKAAESRSIGSKKINSCTITSHFLPKPMTKEVENGKMGIKKADVNCSSVNGISSSCESAKPYCYLSLILKTLPFPEDRVLRIKAYIATVVSYSKISDVTQKWRVTVKINDGTASIDADLAEEVLTDLLGCPLESFQRGMVEASKNRDPVKCKALQQQTKLFEQNLSMISCLMDVRFSTSQPRPVITKFIEATDSDIQCLLQCLEYSNT